VLAAAGLASSAVAAGVVDVSDTQLIADTATASAALAATAANAAHVEESAEELAAMRAAAAGMVREITIGTADGTPFAEDSKLSVGTTYTASAHYDGWIGAYYGAWQVTALDTCTGSSWLVSSGSFYERCARIGVTYYYYLGGWNYLGVLYFFLRQPDVMVGWNWQAGYSSTSSSWNSALFWPNGAQNTAAGYFGWLSDPNNHPNWLAQNAQICGASIWQWGYCPGSIWSNLCTMYAAAGVSACNANANCGGIEQCVTSNCGDVAVSMQYVYLETELYLNPSNCAANNDWINYNKMEPYQWMSLATTYSWALCATGQPGCNPSL